VNTPNHEMPFPCGDTWTGSSRPDHSPSSLSIDWNKVGDLGAIMSASAAGVVTRVADLGGASYGKYLIVDHGAGRTTLYAHLSAQWVTEGQTVDAGSTLGLVGATGHVTGPHLHYEQRLEGSDQRSYFHSTPFVMGTTQTSTNCPDVPLTGNWDKDKASELATFRRTPTGPRFRLRRDDGTRSRVVYGGNTDIPVTGDWNGDGASEIGVRRPGSRAFLLRKANASTTAVNLGRVGDQPVTGDWNGNGTTDLGIWRPSTATFVLRAANGTTTSIPLGSVGSLPVTGDWDGDGRTDLGVYDQATTTFSLRSSRPRRTFVRTLVYGTVTGLPITGDWDGNGTTDLGVWTARSGRAALRISASVARMASTTRTVRLGRVR